MNETVVQKQSDPSSKVEKEPGEGTSRPRTIRFKFFLLLGLCALAVLAFFGIKNRSAKTERLQQQANEAASDVTVSVVKPKKVPASVSVDLPGQTQAYIQAPVFAQTSGYLKRWYFDIGSRVKKDDVLAEIDTPQVDQQLNRPRQL
jgi:multidrug efflux pump subunit AcrA (membrane-fusion protein)